MPAPIAEQMPPISTTATTPLIQPPDRPRGLRLRLGAITISGDDSRSRDGSGTRSARSAGGATGGATATGAATGGGGGGGAFFAGGAPGLAACLAAGGAADDFGFGASGWRNL